MRDLFIEGFWIKQQLEPTPEGEAQIESGCLFFPELKSLGSDSDSLRKAQEKMLLELLENSPAHELAKRIIPEVEILEKSVSIKLDPPQDIPLWGSPLELSFTYLLWEQNKIGIAFVPALGIEIPIIPDPEKDETEVLVEQIHFAIERRRINQHLFDLSLLQRCQKITVERFEWNTYPLSPRERLMKEEGLDGKAEPVLHEIGRRLDNASPEPVFERDAELQQIASFLTGKRSVSSILLVGGNGVGKTALIHNLAVLQKKFKLEEREMYYTPGSRIVAGMCGFGEWQDRCRKMVVEASGKKQKILYFGNLMELMEVGQSSGSTESVALFFRPWLIRGQIIAIAECTPAQLSLIEQKEPRMLEAFRQIKIDPPPPKVALKILKQLVGQNKAQVTITPPALNRIFSLHHRYAGYSALPGKMLHFTRRLISRNDFTEGASAVAKISPALVNQLFALETGLPAFLLDDSAPFDLDKTRAWFQQRIKGQDEAIGHIINTIAGIKANLTRPRRPLGSFLFIGPTGVGKTELAKTLSEFFYGSPERLLRIDMSEYSAPGSSGRLVSGGLGEPEGLLTSKMRDQPFSLVLLDEFEKADSSVFDLFLQVLGEARLTDGVGRLADFSNAMIILTSNLGAAEFSAVAPGFGSAHLGLVPLAIDHFVSAAQKCFRPEFFNRIGRIVPFLPLDHDTVRKVMVREISKLEERDGFRARDLTLVVADEVVDSLVEGGFDPRYGARPLKRTIEEHLLKPIGEYLIEHPSISGGTFEVKSLDKKQRRLVFSYRPESDQLDRGERSKLKVWNKEIRNLRRWYQILSNSHLISELHSALRRLDRRSRHKLFPGEHDMIATSRHLLERLEADSTKVYQLEEQFLISAFENASPTHIETAMTGVPDWGDFCSLLKDIYLWSQKSSSRIMLILTGDNEFLISRFARVYREVAKGYGCGVKCGYFRARPKKDVDLDPRKPGFRKPFVPGDEAEIEALFSGNIPANFAALALEFSKPQIGLFFTLECGLHQFIDMEGSKNHVRVKAVDDETFTIEQGYVADCTLLDRDFRNSPLRRIWNEPEYWMKDEFWGSSIDNAKIDGWVPPSEFDAEAVKSLIEQTLIGQALEAIKS